MRFHFGVSFRPTKILKYIGLGFLGLLAFFGISKVNAAELPVTEISASNGSNNILYCNNLNGDYCPSSYNEYNPPYTEYAGIKYINFDFGTSLTNNHKYSIDIVFQVNRPVSLNDFEQESFTFWSYSGSQLNDTTIIWTQTNSWEAQTDTWITYFHYRGQFTANSSNNFYARLTLEQFESVYGIIVLSAQLVDDDSGDALINANYENTQNIINNANNNTNNIINNNNSNTQEIKDTINDNLQSCRNSLNLLDYNNFSFTGTKVITDSYIHLSNNTGSVVGGMSYIATGSLPSGTYTFINYSSSTGSIFVMLNPSDYSHVVTIGGHYTFNYDGSSYLRFLTGNLNNGDSRMYQLALVKGNMVLPYEKYGEQLCSNKIDNLNDSINNTNQSIQDLNDTISDDTIDTSTSNDFFDSFEDNHHGLSGIVSLPLTTIQSLNNASCTPLTLTIPYLQSNNTLQLPCLTPIYQDNFGVFFILYQTIIFGFVSYYVCVSIFYMVKDFKDPNKDKIEVMDL